MSRIDDIITHGIPALTTELRDRLDVFGVSYGFKRTRGTLKLRSDKPIPCLKVFVYRKGDIDGPEEVIPSTFRFQAGSRYRVVPTDVETVELAHSQASSIRRSPTVAGQTISSGASSGSIGGIVKQGTNATTHLLTARHVVADLQPNRLFWNAESPRFPGLGEGEALLAFSKDYVDPGSNTSGFFDAALVKVFEPELLTDPTEFAWSDQLLSWNEALQVGKVKICGASGVRVANFDASLPTGWPVQTNSGIVNYWRLLQFEVLGEPTQPGDSGAPVLSSKDGRLVGIHLGLKNNQFSIVLSAADILDKLESGQGPGWFFAQSA